MRFFSRNKEAPPVPIPLRRWYANPAAVARLREIVDDPVFKLACAVLEQEAQPDISALKAKGEDAAGILHWLAGYNDFTKNLLRLTQFPETTTEPLPDEWAYLAIQNEDITDE